MSKIVDTIGEAAAYEQLAEECTELAQACLKMARNIRKENPARKTDEELVANLSEEVTDVILCMSVLGLSLDVDIFYDKYKRFKDSQEKKEDVKPIKENFIPWSTQPYNPPCCEAVPPMNPFAK